MLCCILVAMNEWSHEVVFRGSISLACSSICRYRTSSCRVSLLTSFPHEIPWPEPSSIGVHQGGHSSAWPQACRGPWDAGMWPCLLGHQEGDPPPLGLEETQDVNQPLSCCPQKAPRLSLPSPWWLGSVCALGWPTGPSPLSSDSKILP